MNSETIVKLHSKQLRDVTAALPYYVSKYKWTDRHHSHEYSSSPQNICFHCVLYLLNKVRTSTVNVLYMQCASAWIILNANSVCKCYFLVSCFLYWLKSGNTIYFTTELELYSIWSFSLFVLHFCNICWTHSLILLLFWKYNTDFQNPEGVL